MDTATQVTEAFPELDEIDDDDLRGAVVEVWADALEASDFETLAAAPRSPTDPEDVGDTRLVPHIRDVTACSIALFDRLTGLHDHDLDRDAVVAAALLHDVSKLYELSDSWGELDDLLPHPHFGVHLLADAGLPVRLQHVVLSHSPSSSVEPRTFEARLVETADEIATDSLWWANAELSRWR